MKDAECVEIQAFLYLGSTTACSQQRSTLQCCNKKHSFHVSSLFALAMSHQS